MCLSFSAFWLLAHHSDHNSREPNLQLRTAEGETAALSLVLKTGVAVLLFVPAETTETECQALRRTVAHLSSALRPLHVPMISVSFGASANSRSGCGSLGKTHFVADPQRWTLPNLASQGLRTVALLVDQELGIRRVFRADKGALNPDVVVEDTKLWRDGNAIFKGQCARCHGDDGKDESYPGTKSLSGIGNRHSEEKIFELTQLAGFVDLSSLDDRARRALPIFVAGL